MKNNFLDQAIEKIGATNWYSNLHYFRFLFLLNFLLNNSPNKNTRKSVLEIGVWPGYLALALNLAGFEVSGLDLNPERLKEKNYFKNIWQYDLNNNFLTLPCQNNSFDYIVISEVVEHINPQNLPPLFLEIKRILKSNGLVIITTPNQNSLHNKLGIGRKIIKIADGHGHTREYTKKELEQIIGQSQLKISKSSTVNFYANIGTLSKGAYFYPLTNLLQYSHKLLNIAKLLLWPIKQISGLKDSLFIVAKK